jgi:nucleoside-diphosphate-sugar epimerase|tara:strand:+ start:300 stop:1157 length:858 start_codon:yes stop_codon:yes gene_type:complete
MKTLLITGINGYLGSELAKKYNSLYNIIGLEYTLENLFRIKDKTYKLYSSKDGIDDNLFKENKIDLIIHTATFYGRNSESDNEMIYSNLFLPQLLLQKAIISKCPLFINTDTILDRYTSSYSLSKKQFNDWLKFYSNSEKIKVVNLKLEHFYGPGASNSNFISLMINKMLANETQIELTKGEQNRDFLYISDLLNVYDFVIENKNKFNIYEEFNVGTGVNTNLKYIIDYIKETSLSLSILKYGAIPYRDGELMNSDNDVSKLKELGWEPKISIEEGLNKVISFLR